MSYGIFLAEDEIIVRNGIKRLIPWEEYGFVFVGEASDGEMALPLIRQLKPDVVFTDIKMPFMDGLELSAQIKKEMPNIKIVIFSGYDDFKYAKKAMSIGITHYLLKPVSKEDLVNTLKKIASQLEEEKVKNDYYSKFEREIQSYEQYGRRMFFEQLVSGKYNKSEAEKLGISIAAPWYNIVLFRVGPLISEEVYSEKGADMQDEVQKVFYEEKNCFLFRENINSFAVLVMANTKQEAESYASACANKLRDVFKQRGIGGWDVVTGTAADSVENIKKSYMAASKALLKCYTSILDKTLEISAVKASSQSQNIIISFLKTGKPEEAEAFTDNYMKSIGIDNMQSVLFRQYIILNVQFTAAAFCRELNLGENTLFDNLNTSSDFMESMQSYEKSRLYMINIIKTVMNLRNEKAVGKYKSIVRDAIKYIEENYSDENISLNSTARSINISPSYLSSVFSREVGKTFVEFLTGIRMEKAKKLLAYTDKRSSEIAYEVGYSDPHYFSFLFKKTQGISSRAYRSERQGLSN